MYRQKDKAVLRMTLKNLYSNGGILFGILNTFLQNYLFSTLSSYYYEIVQNEKHKSGCSLNVFKKRKQMFYFKPCVYFASM